MPEVISKIPEQFKEFWNNLDKANRNKIIIISIISFLTVIIAVFVISKPQYQSLFSSRLDPKDVGDISTQLDKLNIEYRIGESGTTIEVKKQDFNKAKVSLAQAGYPKSGITFDDLNKTSLGTTDAERRRNYQVYKESDLAIALTEHIENVRNARVMLSLPEQTKFFNADENASKASVIIDSYEELNANQIRAVQKFIAGSIENLDPKDVTILDNQGNMLNDEDGDDVHSSVDKQYALKQTITKGVEKQVKDLLAGIADNVRVMANLDFDFDTMVTSKELYEPIVDDKGVIISREERKETLTNGTTGGVPGTDTNPQTYPNVATGENGNYKMSDIKENYGVNRITSEESKEIGKIKKETSSIAIAMFNNQEAGNADGATAAGTTVDINKIKDIVAKGTGIPGEMVTVEMIDIAALPELKTPTNYGKVFWDIGPIVLVGVLIGLIALLMLRRKNVIEGEVTAPMGSINYAVNNVEEESTLPDIGLEEKSEVKKQIDKFVKQRPDAVAQLLRNWLSEDWD